MEENISVDLVKGKSKKTGRDYECIQLKIGKWSTYVFPRSNFELDYIKEILNNE